MSKRIVNTYTKLYGDIPDLREPFSMNKYSGEANEYVEMLTNSVAAATKMPQSGALAPVLGGPFSATGISPLATGRGVTPNLH
jgi:hypothetical protein